MRSFIVLIGLFLASLANALNLEVRAQSHPDPVCIRDFVQQDSLVVINIKTSGRVGDGQKLDLYVVDSLGNEYSKRSNVAGTLRVVFNSHQSAAFDICFTNVKDGRVAGYAAREIELDIESGAAARDWNAIQATEKLKPNEVELRRIEELTDEIYTQLQYLKNREERMRDTNESTNSRVKYFSTAVILSLIGLGAWQIQYLRHYFKVKHII